MATNKGTSYVDVRRTRASKKDMDDLSDSLAKMVGDVKRLQKAYQNLGAIKQRADVDAAFGNTRGFNTYRAGQRTQSYVKAESTSFLGTPMGRKSAETRETVRQEKQSLQAIRQKEQRQKALNLELKKELGLVNRLTSVQDIQNKKALVEVRAAREATRGRTQQYKMAERLNAALDRRLVDLKEEVRLQKQSAQLSDRQRIEKSRTDTRQRLFGDGGASLFGIQAGLLANYTLMGGAQRGAGAAARFTVELDEALRNLQAIVRITDTDLQGLKKSLVGISEETKFTAVQVTNASVTLGQAGFSVSEIKDSIRAVSLLATATGTELDRAVDIATSTLGVFGMESSEMTRVANTMTEAINTSKLNIEKLTLGLQYSGNIAAQSGVRFEELTAAFGAMANAGIRSGSTLGTGMRQILIGLQKPSNVFIETLDSLGLKLEDVDLKSKGLYGALKTLSDAGFTAKDAIQSFEIRAAAAFNAIQNNLDQVLELEAGFRNTTAAVRANEVQMKSLANQGRRLGSVLGSVVATGLEPMKNGLIVVTKNLGDFFSTVKTYEGTLQVLTSGLVTAGALIATVFTGKLLTGLVRLVSMSGAGTAALMGLTGATSAAVGRMGAGTLALKLLAKGFKFLMGPIGIVIGLVSAVAAVFGFFNARSSQATDELERARTAFDRTSGAMEKSRKSIESVDSQLAELKNRSKELRDDQFLLQNTIQNVKNQFIEMGRDASNVGTDVESLIGSLRDLRAELSEEYILDVKSSQATLENLIDKNRAVQDQRRQALAEPFMDARVGSGFLSGGKNNVQNRAMDSIMSSGGSEVVNSGSSTDDIRLGVKKLSLRLVELRNQYGDRLAAHPAIKAEVELLEKFLPKARSYQDSVLKGDRYAQDLVAGRAELQYAKDQADPRVSEILNQAEKAAIGSRIRVKSRGSDPKISVVDNYENAQREADTIAKEIAVQRSRMDFLIKRGVITSQNVIDEANRQWNLAQSAILEVMDGLQTSAEKVQEDYDSRVASAAGEKLTQLGSKVSDAENPETVANLTDERFRALSKVFNANMTSLDSQGLDRKNLEFEREKLDTWFNETFDKILKDADEKTKDLAKEEKDRVQKFTGAKESTDDNIRLLKAEAQYGRESLEYARTKLSIQQDQEIRRISLMEDLKEEERSTLMISKLKEHELQLEQMKAEFKKRNTDEARKELAELQQQVKIQKLISIFGEDSVFVAKARHKAERQNHVATVKTKNISADLKKELIAAYDAANKFQYVDMASPIEKALGAASKLLSKIGQIGSRMGNLLSEGEILDIEGRTIGQPVERARLTAEAKARNELGPDIQPWQKAGIEEIGRKAAANEAKRISNEKAQEAYDDANDTSGASESSPEFDAMLQRLQNTVEAASLKPGLGGISATQGALGEAQSELQEREAIIARIAGKVTRTAAEEDRMTRLLKERKDLNGFIEQQEQQILDVKGRQGIAQMNLTKSVKEWARANLNLNEAIKGGIGQTLSSLTSGFAQLFTDLTSGAKSAGQAFMDFGRSVVQAMQQALAKMLAVYIMQKLIGAIFPGGGEAGSFGSIARESVGLPLKSGGMVRKARGGEVEGDLMRDSKPHLLMPGEYVLRRSAVQMMGVDELDRLNSMGNTRMASGGHVGAARDAMGQGKAQNLWLVDERTKAPIPGPQDIVAIINDDISRNGVTRTMIKSVQKGV